MNNLIELNGKYTDAKMFIGNVILLEVYEDD